MFLVKYTACTACAIVSCVIYIVRAVFEVVTCEISVCLYRNHPCDIMYCLRNSQLREIRTACVVVSCESDYLLTKCEVCTGKYLPEVFEQIERRRNEVCAENTRANTFPHRPKKEINKEFIIWLFFYCF